MNITKLGTMGDDERVYKEIDLPCFKIHIELFAKHNDRNDTFRGGTLTSEGLHEEDNEKFDRIERAEWETYEAAVNTLESLILAHAVAGVDVESLAYIEGIETTVDAVLNHLA